MTSTYLDTSLSTLEAADAHIRAVQSNFAVAHNGFEAHLNRGSDALCHILADLYVSIETILASTTADVQARILLAHHVKPANARASQFGPWIKVATGQIKPHGEMKKAADGVEYPEWEPNRSFEKYFHVLEELRENNILSDHAAYIKNVGGAMAIVKARQNRLREEAKPRKAVAAKEQRELLLSEGCAIPFKLPFALPEDAGEFFTIVCRRIAGENSVMLGVVRTDAEKDVTALAAAQFDTLSSAKALRERGQDGELITSSIA